MPTPKLTSKYIVIRNNQVEDWADELSIVKAKFQRLVDSSSVEVFIYERVAYSIIQPARVIDERGGLTPLESVPKENEPTA